jgi:hypothetical protein
MTLYGEPTAPRGPSFAVVGAEGVSEAVADAVAEDRFLVLTDPAVRDEVRRHGADIDQYLVDAATVGR